MRKILFILIISFKIVFGVELKLLNVPYNSTIIIDGKNKVYNKLKHTIVLNLESSFFSHDIKIINKEFMPYSFSPSLSNNKVNVHIVKMKYAKEFFTNVKVEYSDKYGFKRIDYCNKFNCSIDSKEGETIKNNLFRFRENVKDSSVDFVVKSEGFYDESDSYDILKNQIVTIKPVSNWALVGIGVGFFSHGIIKNVKLKSGNKTRIDNLESDSAFGYLISYRKNLPINVYIGSSLSFYYSKDDQSTSVKSEEKDMIGEIFFGMKGRALFLELGYRAEHIDVTKHYLFYFDAYEANIKRDVPFLATGYKWLRFSYSPGNSKYKFKTYSISIEVRF